MSGDGEVRVYELAEWRYRLLTIAWLTNLISVVGMLGFIVTVFYYGNRIEDWAVLNPVRFSFLLLCIALTIAMALEWAAYIPTTELPLNNPVPMAKSLRGWSIILFFRCCTAAGFIIGSYLAWIGIGESHYAPAMISWLIVRYLESGFGKRTGWKFIADRFGEVPALFVKPQREYELPAMVIGEANAH